MSKLKTYRCTGSFTIDIEAHSEDEAEDFFWDNDFGDIDSRDVEFEECECIDDDDYDDDDEKETEKPEVFTPKAIHKSGDVREIFANSKM